MKRLVWPQYVVEPPYIEGCLEESRIVIYGLQEKHFGVLIMQPVIFGSLFNHQSQINNRQSYRSLVSGPTIFCLCLPALRVLGLNASHFFWAKRARDEFSRSV
jgi:hypothetical protein